MLGMRSTFSREIFRISLVVELGLYYGHKAVRGGFLMIAK